VNIRPSLEVTKNRKLLVKKRASYHSAML